VRKTGRHGAGADQEVWLRDASVLTPQFAALLALPLEQFLGRLLLLEREALVRGVMTRVVRSARICFTKAWRRANSSGEGGVKSAARSFSIVLTSSPGGFTTAMVSPSFWMERGCLLACTSLAKR